MARIPKPAIADNGFDRTLTQIIDLRYLHHFPFDYADTSDRDDFRCIIRGKLAYRRVVFATPVYWYSMSAPMKVFFDRFTDLSLDASGRELERELAGTHVWLLATGNDRGLPPGFDRPFALTAAYFGMVWRGFTYCQYTEHGMCTDASDRELEAKAWVIEN